MLPCLGRMIPRLLQLNEATSRLPYRLRCLPQKLPSRSLNFFLRPQFSPRQIYKPQQRLSSTTQSHANPFPRAEDILPVCCPGCGAFSHTVEPHEPGYYSKSRKQTRKLLYEAQRVSAGRQRGLEKLEDLGVKGEQEQAADTISLSGNEAVAPKPNHDALLETATAPPSEFLERSGISMHVCDRCHDLLHHNRAVPAVSPSIYSIRELLDESPYKYNRIYHVIDAADFPMSLVDNIYEALSLQEQRSRNRRATLEKYRKGKKLPTITFVITRSDLLAPTKEQVDSKMEFVRSILRETLNQEMEDFRLGNVHMISAHRGWWTKKVKEEIREHGNGIWVVGKANVGKSSFIEACFPKDSKNLEKLTELVERRKAESTILNPYDSPALSSDSLLPPAPREDLYPVLPVVSSLPGTTVSPIRIPFGRGRGEMIDLPGLDRSELADHVVDGHKRDLIMTKRIKPERYSIKPGQSLLLGGGLVRITSVNPGDVVMAACFLPLEAHLTRTDKAIPMQTQQRTYPGESIMKEGTGDVIASAGVFDLKWDVTQSHLPVSLAKAVEDRGIKPRPLPYRVMSTDILIEGCGWVELTVQVRANSPSSEDSTLPQVEVFSPNGQYIGSRPPIECWRFTAEKQSSDRRKNGPRGRQSIGQMKRARRAS